MSKTVFITGATAGFGRACAKRFAADGNRVIITGRRLHRLDELHNQLSKICPVHIAHFDVRDREATRRRSTTCPRNTPRSTC